MTEIEKLKKEAGNWLRKYLLCCNCEKKCNCIDSNSYCEEQVLKAYVDSAEPREKRIAELEKENAELKLKLEALEEQTPWKDIKDKSELIGKLTKAKEIIKKLINTCCSYGATGKATAEAEQFLKEVEK